MMAAPDCDGDRQFAETVVDRLIAIIEKHRRPELVTVAQVLRWIDRALAAAAAPPTSSDPQ